MMMKNARMTNSLHQRIELVESSLNDDKYEDAEDNGGYSSGCCCGRIG